MRRHKPVATQSRGLRDSAPKTTGLRRKKQPTRVATAVEQELMVEIFMTTRSSLWQSNRMKIARMKTDEEPSFWKQWGECLLVKIWLAVRGSDSKRTLRQDPNAQMHAPTNGKRYFLHNWSRRSRRGEHVIKGVSWRTATKEHLSNRMRHSVNIPTQRRHAFKICDPNSQSRLHCKGTSKTHPRYCSLWHFSNVGFEQLACATMHPLVN